MPKITLTKSQIADLVYKNNYPVKEENKFISRCIDGRYPNDKNLPALAFPGADAGELALIFATANDYGFEIDDKLVFKSLVEVVGGEKNLSFHTDSHAEENKVLAGCGHIKQMSLFLEDYKINKEQLLFIKRKFTQLEKKGVKQIILHGEHLEAAVIIVKGDYGLYPQYLVETDEGRANVAIFVYQQSLVDERHRVLVSTLLKNNAVKLCPGCDEDYLYQVMSEMVENHLMETAKRLASGLPIYQVEFDNEGNFEIKEMGYVS